MCGIAGYVGSFDRSVAQGMQESISHRGPDGEGVWFDAESEVALVHTRLAIVDLRVSANQPMLDTSNGNRIVFNGEIYNFRELREELVSRGIGFQTTSDTEVLLKLFSVFGTECLDKLNGIFAFAIWDAKQRQLFLARDQFGIKPLYYAETAEGFIFGSEIKAILKHRGLDRTIDRQAVTDYLTYLYCPWPRTMLQSVKKLPPATALIIRDGTIVKRWNYYQRPRQVTAVGQAEFEYVSGLRGAISDSVKRQLVSDVPIGAFLSGGLDSSAVVAFARKELGRSFECFTIDDRMNDDGFASDLPYAKKVAKALDVRLHICEAKPDIAELLPKMIFHLDEPQADFAALNILLISQLAREMNIKVLLSGAGGDDLFTGYRRHYALNLEKYWSWLPATVRQTMQSLAMKTPAKSASLRRFGKAFSYAGYSPNERLLGYFRWATPELIASILTPEFKAQEGFCGSLESSLGRSNSSGRLSKMLDLEMDHFLPDHNLNYTDKMGMAEGVEIRVPLLDRELVAYASCIPMHLKQRGKTGKYVFKKAMEGLIPRENIYRKKTGFGVPLRKWMRGPLKPMIDDLLSESNLRSRGIFDPKAMSKMRELDSVSKIDASYTVLAAVCVELWCKIFLDAN